MKAKVPGVLKSHNGAPEEGLMTHWGPCFLPHLPPAWLSLQVSIPPPPGPCSGGFFCRGHPFQNLYHSPSPPPGSPSGLAQHLIWAPTDPWSCV